MSDNSRFRRAFALMHINLQQSVLLVFAAVAFAIGGLCMKFSVGLTKFWPAACVFVLFCTGAGLQGLAMRRAELGVAYILVLGVEAVFALTLSVFVLGENCPPARLGAAALILLGIIWLRAT